MTDRHSISPYPIRMPIELRERLEQSAKDGNRSLHAEILARLSETLTAKQSLPMSLFDLIEAVFKEADKAGIPVKVVLGQDDEDGDEERDD